MTGAAGQVGRAICLQIPKEVQVYPWDRSQVDLANQEAVDREIRAVRPRLVLHCAAYTAVDRAESEPALAHAVNVEATRTLATALAGWGGRMVYVSTDFVFGGDQGRPWAVDAPLSPAGVYATTKAAGEAVVRETLGDDGAIVRTSWVYDAQGANFVRTMLRLMAQRPSLGVVADQVGTPTAADGLASMLWTLGTHDPWIGGTWHYSDAGCASWYDFAVAIREEAIACGLLEPTAGAVQPIRTVDYPTPATRPAYSVLDRTATWSTLGVPAIHWRVRLREVLQQLTSFPR